MAQDQVTMNLLKADHLLDLGKLTEIVTEAILPSLQALTDLQSKEDFGRRQAWKRSLSGACLL